MAQKTPHDPECFDHAYAAVANCLGDLDTHDTLLLLEDMLTEYRRQQDEDEDEKYS